jgi:hypothetical protein
VTPAEYEALARAAARQSASLVEQHKELVRLGTQVEHAIGGTSTGEDRTMLDHIRTASARAQAAAGSFSNAAQAARRAASEAQTREAAARRAEAPRR